MKHPVSHSAKPAAEPVKPTPPPEPVIAPLPASYAWLDAEGAPKMLVEMLKLYGVHEGAGGADNALILEWAKELHLSDVYPHDSIAWCGLAMAVVAERAGKHLPNPLTWESMLWADNWRKFGTAQPVAMLGDVLVFRWASGDHHVTMYVGEGDNQYHCLGGNQSDQVKFSVYEKQFCRAIRRAEFAIGQPKNVRPVYLQANGTPVPESTR
jgi:uncharacterized protein (TIGR02594 family)